MPMRYSEVAGRVVALWREAAGLPCQPRQLGLLAVAGSLLAATVRELASLLRKPERQLYRPVTIRSRTTSARDS